MVDEQLAKKSRDKAVQAERRRRDSTQKSLHQLKDASIMTLLEKYHQPGVGEVLHEILTEKIVGRRVKHIWTVDGVNREYVGYIISYANPFYTISYLNDETDYCQLDKWEIGTDYLMQDLHFDQPGNDD